MKPSQRNLLLIVAAAAIVLIVVGIQAARLLSPREVEISGARITELDVAARSGEIEFVHPKSGRTLKVAGTIPDNCPIWINDQPAELNEVRVGDEATIRATIYAGSSVTANAVHIERQQPASQPAADTTTPTEGGA